MRRCLDIGAGALTQRLAGSFTATDELRRQGREIGEATQRLVERTRAAGALRPDVEASDVVLLIWSIVATLDATREVAPDAWRRHLALQLDGLRPPAPHPLPAPALTMEQLGRAKPA